MKNKHHISWVGLTLIAATLAGCGGNTSVPGMLSDLISIAGFAMKGKLQNAKVEAFIVKQDGTVATAASATGTTDAEGQFKLTPEVSKKNRYVLKVSSIDGTKHFDEATQKLQPLGSSFVMQAIAPVTAVDAVKAGETVTVNLTPFSTQEVVAAQKAEGGLSEGNINKAKAVTMELYGFDPVYAKQDDKVLNVMLTAVSQMVKDGKLGCAASTDPSCVVKNLAQSTSISSLKLTQTIDANTVDVSSQFLAVVNSIVKERASTDPELQTAMKTVITNLACSGSSCNPAGDSGGSTSGGSGSGGPAPTQSESISKVKTVLNEILTDMRALFSRDGVTQTSVGALNQQVYQFKNTVDQVNTQSNMISLDSEALSLGGQLYLDYKNGRTSNIGRSSSSGGLRHAYTSGSTDGWWVQRYPAVGCTLYEDSALTIVATSNIDANYVGCMARYALTAVYDSVTNKTTFNAYGHGFTLAPVANEIGKFNYASRARKHHWTCTGTPSNSTNCLAPEKTTLGSDAVRTGTVTLGHFDSYGTHRSMQWDGKLPQSLNFTYSNTTATPTATVTGSDFYDVALSMTPTFGANNELSTLAFNGVLSGTSGTKQDYEVKFGTGTVLDKTKGTGELNLSLSAFGSTNTSRFVGFMKGDTPVTLPNASGPVPTHFVLNGTFSNTPQNGTETQFLKGALDIAATNYASFNDNQAQSANNNFDVGLSFTGSVTAPNQPRLEVVLAATGKSYNFKDTANTINLTYNRYAGSNKTRAVSLVLARGAAGTPNALKKTITLTEATSGLSIVLNQGETVVDVKANGTKVGELNTDKSMFTFADNTTTSMDLWP